MREIKFFDYQSLFVPYKKDLLNIFEDVASRGAFILQEDLRKFEINIANYTGAKHAIGVGNATDALQLLFNANGLNRGDEVIFCSHTMIATASAIKFSGATPVPVEAGKDHLIEIESIKKAITKNTKAIVPTQLNGRVANMDEIIKIANDHNLDIYEDSAQALGAKFKNKFAGTFGVGGCISFYPAKIIGCFGDGGIVLCNDDEVAYKIRLLRDHGRDNSGNISIWGYNSRLDNLQAAFLDFFFKKYDDVISRRRNIARLYYKYLEGIQEILLPPHPDEDEFRRDVFQNFEIEANQRDELYNYLKKNKIGTLLQWGGKAVHEFRDLGFNHSLPNTERIMRRSILLPLNLSINEEDISYISKNIKKFYAKKN